MKTINIPRKEYNEMLDLYEQLKEKIAVLQRYAVEGNEIKAMDAFKYCGAISLPGDAVTIQKHMRDEWE